MSNPRGLFINPNAESVAVPEVDYNKENIKPTAVNGAVQHNDRNLGRSRNDNSFGFHGDQGPGRPPFRRL
jgi:hypothetical protein